MASVFEAAGITAIGLAIAMNVGTNYIMGFLSDVSDDVSWMDTSVHLKRVGAWERGHGRISGDSHLGVFRANPREHISSIVHGHRRVDGVGHGGVHGHSPVLVFSDHAVGIGSPATGGVGGGAHRPVHRRPGSQHLECGPVRFHLYQC